MASAAARTSSSLQGATLDSDASGENGSSSSDESSIDDESYSDESEGEDAERQSSATAAGIRLADQAPGDPALHDLLVLLDLIQVDETGEKLCVPPVL